MNELRIGEPDHRRLHQHLFRQDRDEYGALLLAGHHRTPRGSLLTVREVHLLSEAEFPPGDQGYRQFAASALARLGNRAADQGLALVTVHSHPGSDQATGLSHDDLRAHERIFSHLLDITAAEAVGGVAFGVRSAAGELWRKDGSRHELDRVRVIGSNVVDVQAQPAETAPRSPARFDRQTRMFGDAGQARLRSLHVGVVGAGGGGSILVEQLVHLGVGRITVIDDDVVKAHNLSRIMGATPDDARQEIKKVHVATRGARAIDPETAVIPVDGNIVDADIATRLVDCDFLFLATDTATARLVANAVSQSFLIPMVQVGAKVETRESGDIEQIYTATRPVLPRRGCLACAGLIDPIALQRETLSAEDRDNQNYLGDFDVIDPSVTTLNAAAAAAGLNFFLMSVIGQADDALAEHRISLTREGATLTTHVNRRDDCRWCGVDDASRFARADMDLLPLRRPMRSVRTLEAHRPRLRRALRRLQRLARHGA